MAVPAKAVSEATREREAFRYEPCLLSDYQYSRDGNMPQRAEQSAISDAVLTGLAQLGTFRTHTDRAFVSLFDTTHQYIVAEATSSTRICSNLSGDSNLMLCGSAIPRQQGTCDHVLYLPDPETASAPELPISFVPNLCVDSRFSARPYCQFGEAGQFYAGVPLRTPRGIDIGAYCVMATTAPDSWDEQCAQDLRDISHAVMEHLELRRSRKQARSHERVNGGLSSFVQGKAALASPQPFTHSDTLGDGAISEDKSNFTRQNLDSHRRQEGGEDGPVPSPWVQAESDEKRPETSSGTGEETKAPFIQAKPSGQHEKLATETYSRAATIIREAFEVEGSMFVNAPLNFQSQLHLSGSPSESLDRGVSQMSSTSSSDEQSAAVRDEASKDSCEILGLSTINTSTVDGVPGLAHDSDSKISENLLAKLLRRYPTGKIWNFDATGDLQSSDSSDEDAPPPFIPPGSRGALTVGRQRQRKTRRPARSQEGSQLRRAFPSARSLAFFPLWDQKKERWLAGGFMYTLSPTHLFSVSEELSFLIVFGKLMVAEILNLETLQADKAKSDILGALSHELRSPLHGAVLGTELLNDTELNSFQGNATRTIETCCRTMLDTIEHLLDYAKVNSFAAKQIESSSASSSGYRRRSRTEQFGKKSLYKHTRVDALMEEVVQSVFLGFNYQRNSVQDSASLERSGLTDAIRNISMASSTSESPGAVTFGGQPTGHEVQLSNVAVLISADSTCDWSFFIQPGALRRIVMNLFGNALKYTAEGTIRVLLSQETRRGSSVDRLVKLTVHDTGKGIGEDYLKNKLFKSFSQEDELSPGTGLGLSLVKTITSQLRGHITVNSKVGVGTTVTVRLPLEQSRFSEAPIELSTADQEFEDQRRDLAGLRVRIAGFEAQWGVHSRAVVEDICSRWLSINLVPYGSDALPDIALWSYDALFDSVQGIAELARIPHVVVCRDALEAQRALTKFQHVGQGQSFDFISQPIGPRALARSLLFAYRKWVGLPKVLSAPRPPGLIRSQSLNTVLPQPAAPSPAVFSRDLPQIQVQGASRDQPPPATVAEALATKVPQTAGASSETIPSRFLLVDDNHINLKVLSAYMGKLGQSYETVVNGKEAVDAYERGSGELMGILMDISMPIMDGLEATRRIRAHERRNRLDTVPIIALTGLASHDVQQEARESGVDVFLTKPVTMKALDEALKLIGTRP